MNRELIFKKICELEGLGIREPDACVADAIFEAVRVIEEQIDAPLIPQAEPKERWFQFTCRNCGYITWTRESDLGFGLERMSNGTCNYCGVEGRDNVVLGDVRDEAPEEDDE